MSTLIFDVLFKAAEKVKLFGNNIVGLNHADAPTLLSPERFNFRYGHLEEELTEMKKAQKEGNLAEVTDSLIDLIYIELGILNEMGVAFQPSFEEVHNANMRKKRGELAKRPGALGFDAIKPEGWTGPDYSFLMSITSEDIETLRALKDDRARLILNNTYVPKKKLIIIGHGGHGKDTVCEILRDAYGYSFISSSLFCAEKVVMPEWNKKFAHPTHFPGYTVTLEPGYTLYPYINAEQCYEDRHRTNHHRRIWFDIITKYNSVDKARLGNEILLVNDIYCGLRNKEELSAIKDRKLVDYVIWVDAGSRVEPEQKESCTVTKDDADYIIDNSGTPGQLAEQVDLMVKKLGL